MKIYSPTGTVVGSTSEYMTVYTRGAVFGTCTRCAGTGHRTYEVAPWVRPVAAVGGLAPAEVDVRCDCCAGRGLVSLRAEGRT